MIEHTAPIQKAKIMAETPKLIPNNHPIERDSLASPSPIHLPPEMSHRKAKGEATIGPAKIFCRFRSRELKLKNRAPKEIAPSIKTKEFGIILCLKS